METTFQFNERLTRCRVERKLQRMNDSTEIDFYCIRYQDDDGLIKGRKIEIIAPPMQKDYMLGFLAIQIQKSKKILDVRKNTVELDSKTVAELIQQAKKVTGVFYAFD
jgi:hypothetical protein